jgi:hypothetical protein
MEINMTRPYYLVEGIYPNWAALVKTICNPNMEKDEELCHDARSNQKRCGAGIWCAPSSVGNCPSPGRTCMR